MSGPWRPPPARYRPPGPPARSGSSTPAAAILGRIAAFGGVAAAVVTAGIWCVVGGLALAAGPTCADCVRDWLPPVAVGVLGSLVPVAWWSVTMILQWRRPLLLLWSLLGWPLLGMVNVWSIERFSGLLG